jgi:hypothetical protein
MAEPLSGKPERLAFDSVVCRHIVTHNVNDFHGSWQLGVTALSPCEFLNLIPKKS